VLLSYFFLKNKFFLFYIFIQTFLKIFWQVANDNFSFPSVLLLLYKLCWVVPAPEKRGKERGWDPFLLPCLVMAPNSDHPSVPVFFRSFFIPPSSAQLHCYIRIEEKV
jgi:hypothetical protein